MEAANAEQRPEDDDGRPHIDVRAWPEHPGLHALPGQGQPLRATGDPKPPTPPWTEAGNAEKLASAGKSASELNPPQVSPHVGDNQG